MQFDLFQINSFTDTIFHGNPACVVPLTKWLPNDLLLKIARENAVAETAFFVQGSGNIHLRWFTPEIEMDLCGHATLAVAHVLNTILKQEVDKFFFDTLSGALSVSVDGDLYWLDFPSRKPIAHSLPEIISEALSIQPSTVLKSRDYILVYKNEDEIRNLKIDRQLFDRINLDPGGVVVTAKGDLCDFVSRYFTPQSSILEDPVTGSAHCSLIPYWSEVLKRKKMSAKQISERSGELLCENRDSRVLIGGKAKTYSSGRLWI
ncbi:MULTISPECIES: PhzF family phenazine biosynthesis protein [unclassified Mucilaginibacter]|uniref:PhzF family phenazine biosynthesis protein n=1 Tax=unclassified Mucilaginibacter TaxID=2617802 RepID=UPI003393E7D2